MIPDSEFNFVSQMAHWLSGCLFVLGLTYLFGPGVEWYAVGVFTIYAAIKEFWYDYKYETTEVRGSSFEDFAFYMIGVVLAIALILAKGLLS